MGEPIFKAKDINAPKTMFKVFSSIILYTEIYRGKLMRTLKRFNSDSSLFYR